LLLNKFLRIFGNTEDPSQLLILYFAISNKLNVVNNRKVFNLYEEFNPLGSFPLVDCNKFKGTLLVGLLYRPVDVVVGEDNAIAEV